MMSVFKTEVAITTYVNFLEPCTSCILLWAV